MTKDKVIEYQNEIDRRIEKEFVEFSYQSSCDKYITNTRKNLDDYKAAQQEIINSFRI